MPVTITNGYCTLAQLKLELGPITDTTDDDILATSINAASRQIDGFCGRRFWQDPTVVARTYYADSPVLLEVDDISTTTGLIVATDQTLNGAYSTALTINTDFIVSPTNAAFEVPAHPYTELQIVPYGAWCFPSNGQRPGVQVTAKWGWPAVPDDVTKACLIQAAQLFKAKDTPFGVAGFGEFGVVRVRSGLHPIAASLLSRYQKPALG